MLNFISEKSNQEVREGIFTQRQSWIRVGVVQSKNKEFEYVLHTGEKQKLLGEQLEDGNGEKY